jgi:hypothetical protein
MSVHRRVGAALILAAAAAAAIAAPALGVRVLVAREPGEANRPTRAAEDRFQHVKHARLFPLCSSCHAGVTDATQSAWPAPSSCASCHDGVIQPRVTWQPNTGSLPTRSLRFTHEAHARAAAAKNPADSALDRTCSACHNEPGAPRMDVKRAVVSECMRCHGVEAPHVDAPSESCVVCHIPVTAARSLTRDDIARFPKPRSHNAPGFMLAGHGRAARGTATAGASAVAASCATCHARNFCIACHVNAPESPVIRALALDERSPPFAASLSVPPSHRVAEFTRSHGRDALKTGATCVTCHARESCVSCHIGVTPRVVAAMPAVGPGRAAGVHIERVPPSSHTREFTERHGPEAAARPTSCETCHVRATCLECHRPDATRRVGYHPRAFLARHPSSAYAREANCSDCHNPAQFCQRCHQQSGLVATSRIGRVGYHDAFRGFSLGHGQAARQSLESCASCHAERDCTACHSAVSGGFRFNPHGPGFNAARARSKNPSLCIACHGRAIPSGRD